MTATIHQLPQKNNIVYAPIKPRRFWLWVSDRNVDALMAGDDDSYEAGLTHDGRIPNAVITWGKASGHGWGFVPPWCQLALGRHDAPGEVNPWREHGPFLIIKLWGKQEVRPHFSNAWTKADTVVFGVFYKALVWRKGRGWRWCEVD